MSEFIEDPTDPERAIHAPTGRMAGTWAFAPADADPNDTASWHHGGFVDPRMLEPRSLSGSTSTEEDG